MPVGLMAGVPDDLVLGGVEDVVEGDGDFGRAEAGGEVAAELGDGFQDAVAHLGRDLGQLLHLELPQVRGKSILFSSSMWSLVPCDDIVGQFVQTCGLRANGRGERAPSRQGAGLGAGAVQAVQRGVGQLVVVAVGAFFAHLLLVADDVQDVVGDLEGESDALAVGTEGARLSRRSGQDRAGFEAGDYKSAAFCFGGRFPASSRRRSWISSWTRPRRRGPRLVRRPCPRCRRRRRSGPISSAVAGPLSFRSAAFSAAASNALVSRPSPARMAIASPKTLWLVGLPRRRSSSSMAGRSSWIRE